MRSKFFRIIAALVAIAMVLVPISSQAQQGDPYGGVAWIPPAEIFGQVGSISRVILHVVSPNTESDVYVTIRHPDGSLLGEAWFQEGPENPVVRHGISIIPDVSGVFFFRAEMTAYPSGELLDTANYELQVIEGSISHQYLPLSPGGNAAAQ